MTAPPAFVIVDAPEAAWPLSTVHRGRRHPGQGTENRCVFFDDHFLVHQEASAWHLTVVLAGAIGLRVSAGRHLTVVGEAG